MCKLSIDLKSIDQYKIFIYLRLVKKLLKLEEKISFNDLMACTYLENLLAQLTQFYWFCGF